MSESAKTRLDKLESAIAPNGACCPTCGRLADDEAECARLNAKDAAAHPFDEERFARLYRERVIGERSAS